MTYFAALDGHTLMKEAKPSLASLASDGVGWLGKTIGRSARGSQATAARAAKSMAQDFNAGAAMVPTKTMANLTPRELRIMDRGNVRKAVGEATAGVGNKRQAIAGKLNTASKSIADSPGMQSAINYGGGAAIAGAGLYGANRLGNASGQATGREQGINEGLDAGMDAGVNAAMANVNQQPQPGYLGGLWNAVKGEAGGPGINAGQVYGNLSDQRNSLVQQLMGGNV